MESAVQVLPMRMTSLPMPENCGEPLAPALPLSNLPIGSAAVEDEQFLLRAFRSFSAAADSLERSYARLREEVERLRRELEDSNRDLALSLEENRNMRELRAEAIKRLAQLRQFSPEMAERVSVVLHKRLEALGEQSRRAYAGLRGVADVMNRLDITMAKTILEGIEKEDPKLALSIRNLMFTFEDLLTVPEAGIRELLGQMEKKTLATALRGASEELKNYIFKSMSSRAVEMLKEDMEVLGPVKSRDIHKAQLEAVGVARKLEAEGKISLTPEGDDEYVA